MELKPREVIIAPIALALLIVPYGIETQVFLRN